jgi:hypothetical protein
MSDALLLTFGVAVFVITGLVLFVKDPSIVKSRGVVVGIRIAGAARQEFREVELDVMVSRPEGGQFAVRERAVIPATLLTKVSPGNIIDTYYRRGDESAVAVCVPGT